MQPIVFPHALTDIDTLEKSLSWRPFRKGVDIAEIYSVPGGASAAYLRYVPGASVPLHRHEGYEHIFLLRGSQIDHSGEHHAGAVIINPPGTSHHITSPTGCIVLIVWEKPIVLLPEPPMNKGVA